MSSEKGIFLFVVYLISLEVFLGSVFIFSTGFDTVISLINFSSFSAGGFPIPFGFREAIGAEAADVF